MARTLIQVHVWCESAWGEGGFRGVGTLLGYFDRPAIHHTANFGFDGAQDCWPLLRVFRPLRDYIASPIGPLLLGSDFALFASLVPLLVVKSFTPVQGGGAVLTGSLMGSGYGYFLQCRILRA